MSEHAVPVKFYVAVFAALLALTWLTVWVAGHDFAEVSVLGIVLNMNTIVAVGIACTKATLVILIFMHVRWSGKLVQLFVASGFIWLALLISITLADYISRNWTLMG